MPNSRAVHTQRRGARAAGALVYPIDPIKIDHSFIANLGVEPKSTGWRPIAIAC